MKPDNLDRFISQIEELKAAPARDPRAAAHGRARFLAEASQLREAATTPRNQRLNGWNLLFRREVRSMKTLVSSLLIVFLLAGATIVFAAQNDLPNEPLYGIKTFSEDARLWLTINPNTRLEHLMELAQIRTQEMSALVDQNEKISQQVTQRLILHIETALKQAAGLEDAEMHTSLIRIRAQLETQEQVMTQLQHRASNSSLSNLEWARVQTQEQLRLTNEGLTDPLTFRNRYRYQYFFGTETPQSTGVPTQSDTLLEPGYGPSPNSQGTPEPNSTPGAGNGPNPTPGTSNGANPTQGSSNGPNPTPGTGNGPNPTPGPKGPNSTPSEGGSGGGGGGGGKP
jgi:hypothetical protein